MGNAYGQQKQYPQSLAAFDQALNLAPDFSSAYHNRALTYQKMGEFTQALDDYAKVIALEPEDPSAYLHRGEVFCALQQTEKAKSEFKKACELGLPSACSKPSC